MIKKILLGLVAIIAVILIVAAFQPADYRIVRSATLSAPPAAVFAQVNDLHLWQAWSPWAKLDPAMKTSYAGPATGVGAVSSWDGNNDVGAGSMTITESQPDSLVRFRLDFLKPFKDTCTSDFTFKPAGNQTVVTWSMDGKKQYVSKVMCLFLNMDKMVGGQFETGLADLKKTVEAAGRK
jgi:Polyketide cyclase / dehydrase and lipid transport